MKKRVQKLRLSRETVRHLEGFNAIRAAGSVRICPQYPDPPDNTTGPIYTGPFYTGCASYSCDPCSFGCTTLC